MKVFIFMFIIFLSHLALAKAESVFSYERIDFFQETEVHKEPATADTNNSSEIVSDEWAEPIISPSGQVTIYVPPKEVRDFLEKPDPGNAKAYLAWNLRRIRKFVLAQELLAKEAKVLEFNNELKTMLEANSSPKFNGQDRIKAGYLFYFMSKGCPTCERETRVIEDIYSNYPEIRVEAFAQDFSDRELESFRFPARQDKGMSRLFKVNSYPALVVFNKKKQKYFLSGFVEKERIVKLLK